LHQISPFDDGEVGLRAQIPLKAEPERNEERNQERDDYYNRTFSYLFGR
jgi:hypothetical protein